MTRLLEIAELCEKASGPDRWLDWMIHLRDGLDGVGAYGPHPDFTASLDAAMKLVPEGHDTQVHLYFGRDGEGAAIVSARKEIGQPRIFAATPALAVCAAALRARAAGDAQ